MSSSLFTSGRPLSHLTPSPFPPAGWSHSTSLCCDAGPHPVVQVLLGDPRVSPGCKGRSEGDEGARSRCRVTGRLICPPRPYLGCQGGRTPLDRATENGHADVVRMLEARARSGAAAS